MSYKMFIKENISFSKIIVKLKLWLLLIFSEMNILLMGLLYYKRKHNEYNLETKTVHFRNYRKINEPENYLRILHYKAKNL